MADIKQYVNLDPNVPAQLDGLDKARAGKRVVFEAKINKKSAGVPIRFEITRGAENLFEPGTVSKRIATTDAEGKAVMPFDLTEDGGDEFFVKAILAQDHSNKQLVSDRYIVWRRVYYQMSRFKAGIPGPGQARDALPEVPTLVITPMVNELLARNHNIELVDKSEQELIKRYGTLLTSRNSSVDFATAAKEGYVATLEPVTLRIILANQIGDTKEMSYTLTEIEITGKTTVDVPDTLLDDPSRAKEQDWLVTAEWKFNDDEAFHPLDAKWLKRTDSREVEVDCTGAGFWAKDEDEDKKVDIRLRYRCISSWCNGSSRHNVVFLARKEGDGSDRSDYAMGDTLTHEVGHFLNMVPVGQATHYTAHGHQGRHCHTGLTDGQVQTNDYTAKNGSCIMYGEAGLRRRSEFCEVCDPSLRKSTAKREGMPKKVSDW